MNAGWISRRSVVAAALALALSVPATAQEKVLRVLPLADLRSIDPIQTLSATIRYHGFLVYDTLFGLDADGVPQPQMVDSYTLSDDGMTYVFTLREGLAWHDGVPVTAADSVASLTRWAQQDTMGQIIMENTEALEVVDDTTFQLVLTRPLGFVLDALAKVEGYVPFIMPERLVAGVPASQAVTDPTGSGPFMLVEDEWIPGSRAVYVKNPDYLPRDEPPSGSAGGKTAHFDRIVEDYVPDAAVAVAALGAGEYDFMEAAPNDLLPLIEANPDLTAEPRASAQLWLRLNHAVAPFDSKLVRQAFMHLIDQEEFLAASIGNPDRYRTCVAFFGCGTPNESNAGSQALAGPDLDAAAALLQEAGYAGETVRILAQTSPQSSNAAALMSAQVLRNAGFTVQVDTMEFSTLAQIRGSREPVENGGWSIMVGFSAINGNDNPLTNLFTANCEGSWFGWPCDPLIEELTEQWVYETDPAERAQLIDALQAAHIDNVTYIPLGQYDDMVAFRDDLAGRVTLSSPVYWGLDRP